MAEINYRITTTSLSTSRTQRYVPEKGKLISAQLHFPPGCNQLVEVIVRHGTVQILPTPVKGGTGSTGIALDSATRPFSLNFIPVEKNDLIEVFIINHDNTNSHTISVVILIEEETA
jgi:hypothetical protein